MGGTKQAERLKEAELRGLGAPKPAGEMEVPQARPTVAEPAGALPGRAAWGPLLSHPGAAHPSPGHTLSASWAHSCGLSPAEALPGRPRPTFGHVNKSWPGPGWPRWASLGPADVGMPRHACAHAPSIPRVPGSLHMSPQSWSWAPRTSCLSCWLSIHWGPSWMVSWSRLLPKRGPSWN